MSASHRTQFLEPDLAAGRSLPLVALLLVASALHLIASPVLNYQGRILVDGSPHTGNGYFKFALVDRTATTTYWTNDGTGLGTPGSEPFSPVQLTVTDGLYSTLLGANPMPAIPARTFAEQSELHLRIWFGTDLAGPFERLGPDRQLAAVGYAFHAETASKLPPGYDTGDSNSLALASISGGTLTFTTSFTERFSAPPVLEMGEEWTIDQVTETGFTATTSFASQPVDDDGAVGTYTSVAVINGHPAISFRDIGQSALKFARAGDPTGSIWPSSTISTVDGELSNSGEYTSLAEVAGHPAISYYHGATGDLRFARAADAEGTSWPQSGIVTVDGLSDNVGWHSSLAVVGGVPAISYYAPNSGELRYAWAADAEGISWPPENVVTVDGSGAPDRGRHSSLIEVGGRPAIAYYDATTSDLLFARLTGTDPAVSSDWMTVTIDALGSVGEHASLAIVDGTPAVAYYDLSNGNLKFARASDALGSTWPAGSVIAVDASADNRGQFASLAVFGGRPGIAYHDQTNGNLMFAWAGDAQGSSWPAGNIVAVDGASAFRGTHASITSVQGMPGIAYHGSTPDLDLRYATLPLANWTASNGEALPVLASGVKSGAITTEMLSSEVGVWTRNGHDLVASGGKVGIGRSPTKNALEVEGAASKTVAGNWAANSDRRIKSAVQPVDGALETLDRVRLVSFRYTEDYRAHHPSIADRRYLNVIAQEFAQVFPHHVRGSGEYLPDGSEILQVDTYPLVIYAAAAAQELHRELRSTRAELDELKSRMESLEDRLSRQRSEP